MAGRAASVCAGTSSVAVTHGLGPELKPDVLLALARTAARARVARKLMTAVLARTSPRRPVVAASAAVEDHEPLGDAFAT